MGLCYIVLVTLGRISIDQLILRIYHEYGIKSRKKARDVESERYRLFDEVSERSS